MFAGAEAVNQGDFVGEFVRQKCYLAKNPAFPDWRVYFRVDADGGGNRIVGTSGRDEVIVEYGRAGAGTPAHVSSPYTATVAKGGTAVATYTVPKHWWYARWRYQSSPRPVVRTPATLIARGWIANFGTAGLFGLGPEYHGRLVGRTDERAAGVLQHDGVGRRQSADRFPHGVRSGLRDSPDAVLTDFAANRGRVVRQLVHAHPRRHDRCGAGRSQ